MDELMEEAKKYVKDLNFFEEFVFHNTPEYVENFLRDTLKAIKAGRVASIEELYPKELGYEPRTVSLEPTDKKLDRGYDSGLGDSEIVVTTLSSDILKPLKQLKSLAKKEMGEREYYASIMQSLLDVLEATLREYDGSVPDMIIEQVSGILQEVAPDAYKEFKKNGLKQAENYFEDLNKAGIDSARHNIKRFFMDYSDGVSDLYLRRAPGDIAIWIRSNEMNLERENGKEPIVYFPEDFQVTSPEGVKEDAIPSQPEGDPENFQIVSSDIALATRGIGYKFFKAIEKIIDKFRSRGMGD